MFIHVTHDGDLPENLYFLLQFPVSPPPHNPSTLSPMCYGFQRLTVWLLQQISRHTPLEAAAFPFPSEPQLLPHTVPRCRYLMKLTIFVLV